MWGGCGGEWVGEGVLCVISNKNILEHVEFHMGNSKVLHFLVVYHILNETET